MGLFSKLRKAKPAAELGTASSDSQIDKEKFPESGLAPLTLDAVEVMADMIYRNCLPLGWFSTPVEKHRWTDEVITGICLRSRYGSVRSCPSEHPGFASFEDAIFKLNARVAIKLQSKAVDVAMKNYIDVNPGLHQLNIDADNRIQVLDTVEGIGSARKNQYAAFVRDEGVLVVWADAVKDLIPTTQAIEASLVDFLWQDEIDDLSTTPKLGKNSPRSARTSRTTFDKGAETHLTVYSPSDSEEDVKLPDHLPIPDEKAKADTEFDVEDPAKAEMLAKRKLRPVTLISPFVSGLAVALAVILMSLGVRSLVIRFMYDGDPSRFALVVVLPPLLMLCAFPCNVLCSSLLSLFGPVSQYHSNSAFYSAVPPSRDEASDLVPITVQMPVYKESLEQVIMPTIESLKKAITIFERQGGSVNLIVCDDGLQLVSEADRHRRIEYYNTSNIAYVARPPHGQDGFQRRGRFKKAGNLNHCNALSLRIEDIMDEVRAEQLGLEDKGSEHWFESDEKKLYDEALCKALEENNGKTWASGNIRIGEIILLIDSDTRVPEDCFMDAALEMQQSPPAATAVGSLVSTLRLPCWEARLAFLTYQMGPVDLQRLLETWRSPVFATPFSRLIGRPQN